MPPNPQCSVCRHPDLVDIVAALLSGASHRSVARAYGLSASAIDRHQANGHTTALLGKATQRVEAVSGEDLLGATVGLYERALAALTEAERPGADPRVRIAALAEVRQVLRVLSEAAASAPPRVEADEDLALDDAIRAALLERGHAAARDQAAPPPSGEAYLTPRALGAGSPLEGEGGGG